MSAIKGKQNSIVLKLNAGLRDFEARGLLFYRGLCPAEDKSRLQALLRGWNLLRSFIIF